MILLEKPYDNVSGPDVFNDFYDDFCKKAKDMAGRGILDNYDKIRPGEYDLKDLVRDCEEAQAESKPKKVARRFKVEPIHRPNKKASRKSIRVVPTLPESGIEDILKGNGEDIEIYADEQGLTRARMKKR